MQKEPIGDKEKAIQILDYWLAMDFLNQQSLKDLKNKKDKALAYKNDLKAGNIKPKKDVEDFVQFKSGDNLQSIIKTDSEAMHLPVWSDFTVLLGCMKKEKCIQKIAQNVEWDGQSPDKKL